jgi:hypothetical protein
LPKTIRALTLVLILLAAAALPTVQASATTTVGSPVVGAPGTYDYSPSVMQSGGVQQFWWCTAPNDVIVYEAINLSPLHVITPETIVLRHGPTGAWDSRFTCNPHVVRGQFANPLGDGTTYTYAMYYVALADGASGGNNIGVAFSLDGITWHKYPTPVITTDTTAYYGVGQPDLFNPHGATGSDIEMVYEHTDASTSHIEATSTDGVHFTVAGTLSTTGLPPGQKNNLDDIAYDPATGTWYGLYDEFPARPTSTTGGIIERGQPGETLYSTTDLLTGTWTQLDTVDTATTGYESNFIGTLLRDPYGNLLWNGPSIEMYLSTSIPRPAVTATPAQAAQSAAIAQWDIAWSLWTPGQPLRKLVRYYSGGADSPDLNQHEVTTGYHDAGAFTAESTVLGSLYEAPTGAATQPLYSCKLGSENWFVSQDPQCEGTLTLGLLGYAYPSAPTGVSSIPLYRCYVPGDGDHFLSADPACEGRTTEKLLGFSVAPA